MGARLLTGNPGLLEDIADRAGTPVYVYDAEAIRAQYRALDGALGAVPHRLFYSVKASSNLVILGLLRSLGAGADVVSQGEIERTVRAGFAPGDIVFSGVGKTEQELRRALEVGIRSINVESFAELRLLDDIPRDLVEQPQFRKGSDRSTSNPLRNCGCSTRSRGISARQPHSAFE